MSAAESYLANTECAGGCSDLLLRAGLHTIAKLQRRAGAVARVLADHAVEPGNYILVPARNPRETAIFQCHINRGYRHRRPRLLPAAKAIVSPTARHRPCHAPPGYYDDHGRVAGKTSIDRRDLRAPRSSHSRLFGLSRSHAGNPSWMWGCK